MSDHRQGGSSSYNFLVCTISYLFPDLPTPAFHYAAKEGNFLQNQICGRTWEQDYLALGLSNAFLVCLWPNLSTINDVASPPQHVHWLFLQEQVYSNTVEQYVYSQPIT